MIRIVSGRLSYIKQFTRTTLPFYTICHPYSLFSKKPSLNTPELSSNNTSNNEATTTTLPPSSSSENVYDIEPVPTPEEIEQHRLNTSTLLPPDLPPVEPSTNSNSKNPLYNSHPLDQENQRLSPLHDDFSQYKISKTDPYSLHSASTLPPAVYQYRSLDTNSTIYDSDPTHFSSDKKLLDDSFNYDAMEFERLLESFEEAPFQEVHTSSCLGHTIVVYKNNPNKPNSGLLNKDTANEPTDGDGTANNLNLDSNSPDVSVAYPSLFNHSCGLNFKFAVGGYAYHTSKNPSRKIIMDSLPSSLFSRSNKNIHALDNGTPISISRGEHDPGNPENLSTIDDIPIESFDKIEMKASNVTSMGCGEDSVVASPQLLCLADGVSGWNLRTGGHAALWSRLILHRSLSNYVDLVNSNKDRDLALAKKNSLTDSSTINEDEKNTQGKLDLYISQALDKAFYETQTILKKQQESGSSTIILTALDPVQKKLHIISIGDSSIWVFRDGKVIYTVDHGVKADCPKQLGTQIQVPNSSEGQDSQSPKENLIKALGLDPPYTIDVQEGDFIVMGSDGLSDNLFISEITETLQKGYKENGVQGAADSLVYQAYDRSFDSFAVCPYQLNASPFSTGGGKTDDISVIVAEVVLDKRKY